MDFEALGNIMLYNLQPLESRNKKIKILHHSILSGMILCGMRIQTTGKILQNFNKMHFINYTNPIV